MIARVVGTPPMNYQWQFNGVNIVGATKPWLYVTNAQPANTGNYRLVVSNSMGVTTGSIAGLVVSNSVPIIISQPGNVAAPLGDDAFISVTAAGSIPISYQWRFNGVNILGATNATLELANVSAYA